MTHYRRRSTDLRDDLVAFAVGLAAGAAGAYLARLFLRRGPVDRGHRGESPSPREGREGSEGRATDGPAPAAEEDGPDR